MERNGTAQHRIRTDAKHTYGPNKQMVDGVLDNLSNKNSTCRPSTGNNWTHHRKGKCLRWYKKYYLFPANSELQPESRYDIMLNALVIRYYTAPDIEALNAGEK